MKYLTEIERAYGSSRIHKCTAVWLVKDLMNGPVLAAMMAQLNLFSNNANKHEGTIQTYKGVVNRLLRPYVEVIAEVNRKM